VPTIDANDFGEMVGTLRFAHPTIYAGFPPSHASTSAALRSGGNTG
jgi:hypothetical protein